MKRVSQTVRQIKTPGARNSRMSQRLQLRSRLSSGPAIRHGADAHPVAQREARAARHQVDRKSLAFQLTHQFVGVGAAGEAAQLHRPGTRRCRRLRRWCGRGGGRRRRFKRCAAGAGADRHRSRRRSHRCRARASRAARPARSRRRQRRAAGSGSGGLLVARSTVTLRTGSGAIAGRIEAVGGAGAGPDNSSGTIDTISAARIAAPTRRSLTRRSIAQP